MLSPDFRKPDARHRREIKNYYDVINFDERERERERERDRDRERPDDYLVIYYILGFCYLLHIWILLFITYLDSQPNLGCFLFPSWRPAM